jgi:5-methylcytosine-specific restriction endonuclease McrA
LSKAPAKIPQAELTDLVTRSTVPAGLKYTEYRPYLRIDFAHSCAYCATSEAESLGQAFAIDHYEPQQVRPELVNEYTNLMYACVPCNTYKSDRVPSDKARAAGVRFFRPDQDKYGDHFERNDRLLKHKTPIGEFTILACFLNRGTLQKIRDVRDRLSACDESVQASLKKIGEIRIDQLPVSIRGRAVKYIRDAEAHGDKIPEMIDEFLRNMAKSHLLDSDPEADSKAAVRQKDLKHLEGLHPGRWRGPRRKKSK